MVGNAKQYTVVVRENGEVVEEKQIHDPFLTRTIKPKGLLNAIRVLFGFYAVTVAVDGSDPARRVVYMGDYSPGPSVEERIFSNNAAPIRFQGSKHSPLDLLSRRIPLR